MDERFLLRGDLPIRRDEGGALRVGQSRVAASLVLRGLRSGESVADLLAAFPSLRRADIECLAEFCASNSEQVAGYLASVEAESASLTDEGRERQAVLMSELHRRAARAARVG